MKKALLLAALVAGCVSPAAGAANCTMTAAFHDTPVGRQITATGAAFAAGEPITIGGHTPKTTLTIELAANDAGGFLVEIAAAADGTYVVGPATGQLCTAAAVTLTTPTATAKPTVPPLPIVTMPPTDTE